MVKKLHRESKLKAIADAIRTKKGESSSTKYKVSEMANAISTISGGTDYTTTLNLTSNKAKTTGAVTLYAEVDNTTTISNLTANGYLENATVSFYKLISGVRTLLGTSTTNNGIATYNTTITEDTTFIAEYSDNTHYDTCNDNIDIEYYTLPYQQVEWVGSTGTQYINTGYTLKANDKVETTFSPQSGGNSSYQAVFGARKSSYSSNCFAFFNLFGGSNSAYARTGNESSSGGLTIGETYDLTAQNNTCTLSQNGSVVKTITSSGTINDCYNPCGLFCLNTNSSTGFTIDTYGAMRISSFKVTNSDDEVQLNLIPCYRLSDDEIGFWDLVNDEFYGNDGTGTFTKGADVNE